MTWLDIFYFYVMRAEIEKYCEHILKAKQNQKKIFGMDQSKHNMPHFNITKVNHKNRWWPAWTLDESDTNVL